MLGQCFYFHIEYNAKKQKNQLLGDISFLKGFG